MLNYQSVNIKLSTKGLTSPAVSVFLHLKPSGIFIVSTNPAVTPCLDFFYGGCFVFYCCLYFWMKQINLFYWSPYCMCNVWTDDCTSDEEKMRNLKECYLLLYEDQTEDTSFSRTEWFQYKAHSWHLLMTLFQCSIKLELIYGGFFFKRNPTHSVSFMIWWKFWLILTNF